MERVGGGGAESTPRYFAGSEIDADFETGTWISDIQIQVVYLPWKAL